MSGRNIVTLDSGEPWRLTLTVEEAGRDLLCRLHGGAAHVGAVALAEWGQGRASTAVLTASGHREDGVAAHAAHRLCRASRKNVACVAGIHFDALVRPEVEAIVRQAHDLVRRAAAVVEDRRMRHSVETATLRERIERRAAGLAGEIEAFLGAPLDALLERHRENVAGVLARNFHNRVRLFAPLYLSSACANDCIYCGFRRSAEFHRTRLSVDEAEREASLLAAAGHSAIDLVTGEVPTDPFVDYVAEVTRRVLDRTTIRRVHLNLGALTEPRLRRLRQAGAVGYHLYQETYDTERYFALHRAGPKRDMAERLEVPHRAARAGFRSIGLGVLLGLAPPAADLARTAAHAMILAEEFPSLRLGFSLPRVREVETGTEYRPEYPVDDDTFAKALLFLRLRFPDAHLTLTTRERAELRDRLVPLGVTKLSAGVSTAPGGYAGREEAAGQFEIADARTRDEVAEVIRHAGLIPA